MIDNDNLDLSPVVVTSLGILSGRYDLLDSLGNDALFRLFRARDIQSNTLVTIKLSRSVIREYPDVVDAIRVGAVSNLSVRSDYIAALLDVVEDAGNGLFVVEQYTRGSNLRIRLGSASLPNPLILVDLLSPVLAALQEAHAQGAVYGYLMPENIIVGLDGRSVVAGWGCAHAWFRLGLRNPTVQERLSHYSAPEITKAHTWTPSSDMFTFGVVLYESVTGQTLDRSLQDVSLIPASTINPMVPKALDNIIAACLEPEGTKRHITASTTYQKFLVIADNLRNRPNAGNYAGSKSRDLDINMVSTPLNPTNDTVRHRTVESKLDRGAVVDEEEGTAVATGEKSRNASFWAMITASFLLLISVIGLFLLIRPYFVPAEIIYVPALRGKTLSQAEQIASELGFKLSVVGRREMPNVAMDVIYQVREAEGQTIRPGGAIAVWVSDGPEKAAVPDLIGLQEVDAIKALTDAGFAVGLTTKRRDLSDPGTVNQQSVPEGSLVARGTLIDIIVSAGDEVIPGEPQDAVTPDSPAGDRSSVPTETLTLPESQPDEKRTVVAVEGESIPKLRKKRIVYQVPNDGIEHQIRLDVEDGSTNSIVYEQTHAAGESVKIEFKMSSRSKVRLFDNDTLKGVGK